MTKRADKKFEPKARSFYATPASAVLPVVPFLVRDGIQTFAEPCVGDGRLVNHLTNHGFRCVAQGDINDNFRTDATQWDRDDFKGADAVITNPPWDDWIMPSIMVHQSFFVPCWFLVYWDWLANIGVSHLVESLVTDAVPIGRVKWIADSPSVGFDNACWIRMSTDKEPGLPAHLWPRT